MPKVKPKTEQSGMPKKLLLSPYPYILLLTYFGIWLAWDTIRIPFRNPAQIISYLPTVGYNPNNNIARFLLGVFGPPLACLVFWWFSRRKKSFFEAKSYRRALAVGLVGLSLLLAAGMGIVQGSSNPKNNPTGVDQEYAQIDSFHEGESIGPAISYQQKDLKPYKDVVFIHGVFQDPGRAILAFKLFGRSLGSVRALATILTMVVHILLFGFLLVLFRGHLAKAALALAMFALVITPNVTLPLAGPYLMGTNLPFRDITTLFLLAFAILGLRSVVANRMKPALYLSGLIGFIVSVNFANSTDRAMYGAVLSFVWLAMMWLLSKPRLFAKNILLPYIVGLVPGILITGMALKWAFVDFATFLISVGGNKEFWDGLQFARPELPVSITFLTLSVFVTVLGSYLLSAWNGTNHNQRLLARIHSFKKPLSAIVADHHIVILLLLATLMFMRSAIGRADLGHFAYSTQWLWVLLIYLLIEWFYRKKLAHTTYIFVTIALLGSVTIAFLGYVKRINLPRDAFPIHVPDERFFRKDHLETADYLRNNLKGDETFITLTSEASWYYLVDKPSPVKYPIIWFAFIPKERRELAESIRNNHNIKYAITNKNWTSAIDGISNEERFPELFEMFYKDFEPVTGFGQQTVWQRKN